MRRGYPPKRGARTTHFRDSAHESHLHPGCRACGSVQDEARSGWVETDKAQRQVVRKVRDSLERTASREHLGRAIRKRRTEVGWTLAELATRSGLSVSLISQVERGLVDPSLDSLRDISFALGTTPFAVLEDGHIQPHIVRRGEGLRLTGLQADVEYELLSPTAEGAFEVARAEIVAGGATMDTPRSHPGTECAVAIKGTIYIEIGNERIRLDEGDSATYDPRIPHRTLAGDDGDATVLLICSPPSL
jgi:transcriptional regulator with XRE-family HTH domain